MTQANHKQYEAEDQADPFVKLHHSSHNDIIGLRCVIDV